jgi:hypothetical protein
MRNVRGRRRLWKILEGQKGKREWCKIEFENTTSTNQRLCLLVAYRNAGTGQ